VIISPTTAIARVEEAQGAMVPREITIHLTVTDPDANKIIDRGMAVAEGCNESFFNRSIPKMIEFCETTKNQARSQAHGHDSFSGSLAINRSLLP
jgi:hypothetical protein